MIILERGWGISVTGVRKSGDPSPDSLALGRFIRAGEERLPFYEKIPGPLQDRGLSVSIYPGFRLT